MICKAHLIFEIIQSRWVLFELIVSVQLSFLCT